MALTVKFDVFNVNPQRAAERPGNMGGIPKDLDRSMFQPALSPRGDLAFTNIRRGQALPDDGVFNNTNKNRLQKAEIPDKDADTFEVVNFTTYFDGESDGS